MAVAALRAPVSHTTARPDDAARPARPNGPRPVQPLLQAPLMRLITLTLLAAFGAGHWMAMVEPAEPWRGVGAVAVAVATALALLRIGRLARVRRRRLALLTLILVGFVVVLAVSGLPLTDLRPTGWGVATSTIASGLDGLAGARIPYRGIDAGLRLVLPLGGVLLAFAFALLAFWPRRGDRLGFPLWALVVGVALYAVPAVVLILDQEFVRGAVLTLLVLLFWRGERLPRTQAAGAAGAAGVAIVVALAAAPALDLAEPLFDYEDWAQEVAGGRTESFRWDHDYSALLWPRDGREMLRIEARSRSYWKVETLDGFDGREWDVDGRFASRQGDLDGIDPQRLRRWTQDLEVSVRSLVSTNLPVAGTTLGIDFPGRDASVIHQGIWTAGRELRRGDAYRARVYTPQPSRGELEHAGAAYDETLRGQTAFEVRSSPSPGAVTTSAIAFVPGFKAPVETYGPGRQRDDGAATMADSSLARTYRLSRRLLADASTPYDYVQAIQRHLRADGYRYSEAPPIEARTLDGFLFDARSGFCQQYSGAMALLLRMGGVPARVVTGFAPGAYNRKADQFVVRDLDAHSWVEAYFPGLGWVTFDPTPSAAPPRTQASPTSPSAGNGDVRDLGTTLAPSVEAATQPQGEEELPWPALVGGAAGLVALGLLARLAVRRRRRPRPPAVLELEAALRSVGRRVAPGVTLGALERELSASPAAVEYVRALRAQRYGPVPTPPTDAQRRRLRSALQRGRSPLARLRAWRALPPRLRRRRA